MACKYKYYQTLPHKIGKLRFFRLTRAVFVKLYRFSNHKPSLIAKNSKSIIIGGNLHFFFSKIHTNFWSGKEFFQKSVLFSVFIHLATLATMALQSICLVHILNYGSRKEYRKVPCAFSLYLVSFTKM